jgi:hypothetical protein
MATVRSSRVFAIGTLALGCVLWAVTARAFEVPEAPVDAASEQDAATRAARRHFQSGIKLYRDTNYSGALAEFEAAYRDKPGPGSLQNVALSLKALFRYAEASETLKLLLERHRAELAEREQAAVRAAIDELEALIGTLKLSVVPDTASVSVNGREIGPEERVRGIKLNVGEHVIIAEAPGYARGSRIVRIAGQQAVLAEVALQATSGFLHVTTRDPEAAIAVDGEPRGYQSWSGPVSPDAEHLVQVYRSGFEPFERSIRVGAGQTLRVEGTLGEQISDAPPRSLPLEPEAPPPPRAAIGFYGLAALGVLGMSDAPLNLRVDQAKGGSLSTAGLRAGYRLSEPIAVEAAVDVGRLAGEGACQAQAQDDCYVKRDFTLTSIRFGPNLRLFTRGETLRFALGVGAGAVAHRIKLDAASAPDGSRLRGGSAAGVDPYFSFELGGAFNYRHLLAELAVMAFVEGADNLAGPFDEQQEQGVFSDGTLPLLGVGLKLGYSAWAPKR